MKNTYPVFFTKTGDVVLVEVPDLEILTEGKDMSDAAMMARDAIGLTCVVIEDQKEIIPKPSSVDDLDITKGAFYNEGETVISYIDIDTDEYRKVLRKIEENKIKYVVPMGDHVIFAVFQNGTKKTYDIHNLYERFPQFKIFDDDPDLFHQVKVDPGGYGISWNDELDLDAEDIWEFGGDVQNTFFADTVQGLLEAIENR